MSLLFTKHSFALLLVMIQIDAIIDYFALPYAVRRYAKTTTNHARVERVGRFTIAVMVGFYTLLDLVAHRYDCRILAAFVAAYLCLDVFLACRMMHRGREKA